MGTNYFARKLPSMRRKEYLKQIIDEDMFDEIKSKVNFMYGSFSLDGGEPSGGEIHLGKRSGGWKFLWNPNIFQVRNGHSELIDNPNGSRSSRWIVEPDTPYYVYPLTKKGIKEFIDREDIEIYDEYGEKQNKEEFWKMALEWTTWKDRETNKVIEAWDADSYDAAYPNERHLSCRNEYTDFLEGLGYKLSKYKSDFYSDGLRFATTTEFS